MDHPRDVTTDDITMRPMPGAAVLLASLLAASPLAASPTSQDLRGCNRMAAMVLQQCLDRTPGRLDGACWTQSRQQAQRCLADVRDEDARVKERARAARKAERAAR